MRHYFLSGLLFVFLLSRAYGQEEDYGKREIGLQAFTFFPESRDFSSYFFNAGVEPSNLNRLNPFIIQYRQQHKKLPVSARAFIKVLIVRKNMPLNENNQGILGIISSQNSIIHFRCNYEQFGIGLQRHFSLDAFQFYTGLDAIFFHEELKFREISEETYRQAGGSSNFNFDSYQENSRYMVENGWGFALPIGINIRLYKHFRFNLESGFQYHSSKIKEIINAYEERQYTNGNTSLRSTINVYNYKPRRWYLLNTTDLKMMLTYTF